MEHYHFETFSFVYDLWSSKEAQLLTFITGEDGEVSGLQLEYEEKKWTFEKEKVTSSPSFAKSTLSNQKEGHETAIEQKETGTQQRVFAF